MRTVAHPRGRLPARIYWFRRTLVLLTAVVLVLAIGKLLGGSGSHPSGDTAAVVAAKPSTTPTPGIAGPQPLQPAATGKHVDPGPTGNPVTLAVPDGPCAADEITVTPSVPTAVAAGRVDLVLELTGIKPACTFSVSSRTLAAKVTSGKDRIWSTQDCPTAVKTTSVIVRSAEPATVVVPWSGRRSDEDCSNATSWALPGFYHLTAAVIGSEPGEVQFKLELAPRPVITKTAHPKKKHSAKVD